MLVQLGQSMNNKIQKGQNSSATSEVLGAKAGFHAWPLHTAPPRGWADHLSHPSGLTHQSAGTHVPVKPRLNFSSGFLLISIASGVPEPRSVTPGLDLIPELGLPQLSGAQNLHIQSHSTSCTSSLLFLNFLIWNISNLCRSRESSIIIPHIPITNFKNYQLTALLVSSTSPPYDPKPQYFEACSRHIISSVNISGSLEDKD